MKAVVIKTNGARSVVEFTNDTSYDVISGAVGGLIECVTLTDKEGSPDMWCNEEGKVIGLEQNPIATALWVDLYSTTDVICGDVVITGRADEEGYTQGLTEEQLHYFLNYDRNIVHMGLPMPEHFLSV